MCPGCPRHHQALPLIGGGAELDAGRPAMAKSPGQVLWALGFAGLGTSCGAREATPYLSQRACTLTILGTRQLAATHGNGFRLSAPFSRVGHLPPVASRCDRWAP